MRILVFGKEITMLHLAVKKDFTYLNYLSVMSAIKGNKVTMWIVEEPTGRYWDLVKKVKSITFKNVDPVMGTLRAKFEDKIGRTDIIYLGELNDNYVTEAMVDHTGIYEENGEFEAKDMCLVRIFRPEVVTLEYITNNKTTLANLVQRVLMKRVWNQ